MNFKLLERAQVDTQPSSKYENICKFIGLKFLKSIYNKTFYYYRNKELNLDKVWVFGGDF